MRFHNQLSLTYIHSRAIKRFLLVQNCYYLVENCIMSLRSVSYSLLLYDVNYIVFLSSTIYIFIRNWRFHSLVGYNTLFFSLKINYRKILVGKYIIDIKLVHQIFTQQWILCKFGFKTGNLLLVVTQKILHLFTLYLNGKFSFIARGFVLRHFMWF